MAHSRALNYDKNVLVKDKQWEVALHHWIPQTLESQTKHFSFPIFKRTASQGLYVPSPFGHRMGGWRTIATMIYNDGLKHKSTEEHKSRPPKIARYPTSPAFAAATTRQLTPFSTTTLAVQTGRKKAIRKKPSQKRGGKKNTIKKRRK